MMLSSLPYYAVVVNLLYSFNLVNYSDLDEIFAFQTGNISGLVEMELNEATIDDLVDSPKIVHQPKMQPEVVILSTPSTDGLPQPPVSKPWLEKLTTSSPGPSFTPLLFWSIGIYLVSLQGKSVFCVLIAFRNSSSDSNHSFR